MKNKTVATWLAFLLGTVGAHRFYLHGWRDPWGWTSPVPTLLGLYGVWRARAFGLDDPASWVLIPLLGLMIAIGCLTALVYGLATTERWNARFNPDSASEAAAGQTSWFTVAALVAALMVGATALLATLAFGFQKYFESQVEEARRISQ